MSPSLVSHQKELTMFANPQVDIAFKKLFGVQKDSALTINFLNAILGYQKGEQIAQPAQQRIPISLSLLAE